MKSNPYASDVNAVQSHVGRIGPNKEWMPNFNFNFASGTPTDLVLQLTAGVEDTLRYAKYTVQDDSGNEVNAAHDMTNATTKAAAITIDCSTLRNRDKWRIVFKSALEDTTRIFRHIDLLEGEVYQLQQSNAVQGAWVTP